MLQHFRFEGASIWWKWEHWCRLCDHSNSIHVMLCHFKFSQHGIFPYPTFDCTTDITSTNEVSRGFKGEFHWFYHRKVSLLVMKSTTQPVDTSVFCFLWLLKAFVKSESDDVMPGDILWGLSLCKENSHFLHTKPALQTGGVEFERRGQLPGTEGLTKDVTGCIMGNIGLRQFLLFLTS